MWRVQMNPTCKHLTKGSNSSQCSQDFTSIVQLLEWRTSHTLHFLYFSCQVANIGVLIRSMDCNLLNGKQLTTSVSNRVY